LAAAAAASAFFTLEMWIEPSRSTIAPLRMLLALARVPLDHLHAFDDDALISSVITRR
jgi:hypothetical protein